MIDTMSVAMNGLEVGFTPMGAALAGFFFEITIVTPNTSFSGGSSIGAGSISTAYAYPYRIRDRIILRIKHGDREWEEEYEESLPNGLFLPDSEDVIVQFLRLRPVTASATFLKSMINNTNVTIKVRKL